MTNDSSGCNKEVHTHSFQGNRSNAFYFSRYVVSSPLLEEVNVEGNWIGEGGAREVMLALQRRKEAGLPVMKLRVSPRICPEIFAEIMQLTTSSGRAKKKRSGKGKRKVKDY